MPKVFLNHDSTLSLDIISKLAKALPNIIAPALSVPGYKDAELTSSEIEVHVSPHGKLDVNTLPVEITIFANNFRPRSRSLDHRTAKIVEEIRNSMILPSHLMDKKNSFVWILLAKGSFKMI